MEYKDNRYFDGVRVDTYIACSDRDIVDDDTEDDTDNNVRKEPVGVVYHELGHYLGLPDLYDSYLLDLYDPDESVWKGYDSLFLSTMNAGSSAEDQQGRSRPSAFDAWSRVFLHWVEPEIAGEDGTYELFNQDDKLLKLKFNKKKQQDLIPE